MARRLRQTLAISISDAPRDHFYLAVCKGKVGVSPVGVTAEECSDDASEQASAYESCAWFVECGKAPFKAKREARTHARRNGDHETQVIDLSAMRCVTRFRFTPIAQVGDENGPPPF